MFSASSRAGTITTTRGHRLGDFSSAVSSCTCQKFPRAKNRYSQLAKGMAASRVGVRGTRYLDRKSTRLNSSHGYISYAVFCLKKKKKASHSIERSIRILNKLCTEQIVKIL